MSQNLYRVFALVLMAVALMAQEPDPPTFDSTAKLVFVPFNVQRGKFFAADLQPSDVILREDGHPRPFTTFEGPNTPHPLPLELILLFDTTTFPPKAMANISHWNPKADYEFIDGWDERLTGGLLQQNGSAIRMSVYHYSGRQLERLCGATSDPREIGHAFQALLDPIPQGKGELTLLPGSSVRKPMFEAPFMGWLAESIVTTLKDATASPVPARRLLLVFTTGMSGTGENDLRGDYNTIVGPAFAANVPINPVIMNQDKMHVVWDRPGPGGVFTTVDMPEALKNKAGVVGNTGYQNLPWFAAVGARTGGEVFVPHQLDREALAAILKIARDVTLSQYVVGFTPDSAQKPKKHSLGVALTSKSSGRIVGGEKNGILY